MVDVYTREVIRVCVAQICQLVGWNAIQSTPLELLTDILQDFIRSLAQSSHNYAMLFGQNEPNLDHLGLAFGDMGISVTELSEYIRYVDTSGTVPEIPKYPIPRESRLNHLKPGSREVVTRPVHIHEHLPPMHPHMEEQDYALKQSPVTIDTLTNSDASSSLTSPKTTLFKRPGDPVSNELGKRTRLYLDEEIRPLREISSVMMTTSGFLSPAREGKLPEARTPSAPIESRSSSPDLQGIQTESKSDKKRRAKSNVDNLTKENENIKEEFIDNSQEGVSSKSENTKVKKSNILREVSKLKALKSGALKAIAQTSQSPAVGNKGTKPPAHPKSKHPTSVSVQTQNNINSTKLNRSNISKSPKNERINILPLGKELSSSIEPADSFPDEKLPSEPDKQKLNIFRKISKVKEELSNETDIKHDNDNDGQWSQVDETIEAVIQHGRNGNKEPLTNMKEDQIDAEINASPTFDSPIFLDEQSIPGTPTTPRTPDLPKFIEYKKKKRDRRKDKGDKYLNSSPMIPKSLTDTELLAKPKTPEVDMSPEETTTPPSIFPFFHHFPSGPGLIPPPIPIPHPLMPRLPLPLTKQVISPTFAPNSVINNPQEYKNPQDSCQLQGDRPSPLSQTSTNVTPEITTDSPMVTSSKAVDSLKKKEKKEKKLKDKIKKKKDKKDKSKDKSDKKKIKLEKKEREKEKAKLKKEKKEKKKEKEKEILEEKCSGTEPTTSVPKITLKLGPASPQDCPSETPHRKIVIKPLVKRDDDPIVKSDRPPSPELARISPLVPRPLKHKGIKNTFQLENNSKLSDQPSILSISNEKPEVTAPTIKVDNEGNEVWICPACGRQDDGSPMIGCDGCDAWYHWVCVGIQVPPESSEWFCRFCISRKEHDFNDKKKKNRKKKLLH